ncbi:MAG: flippase-like domain-containing protein [Candidatus Cloacimonetes bacterium]|nr:flippase-like domain-containing protein [Candidatus Cloacimonadota bacterium]
MIKKNLNLIIGIILGILFLILWLHIVDWQKLLWYFNNYDLTLIPLFSGFYIFAYLLRSWRWRLILKPELKMGYIYCFQVFMAGMLVNYVIPVRAGELAKSVILKNKDKLPVSRSLPSIFIDKITDLFPIMLIIILLPLLTIRMNKALYLIVFLLLVIYLLFLVFLFFAVNHRNKAQRILAFCFRPFPASWKRKLDFFAENFIDGLAIMQGRTPEYLLVYLLTILAVLSEAFYVFTVFHAFGSTAGYFMILFGYTLMNLTYILPTPPAQIGSNQFMWALIFSFALGIDENLTGAAVLFSHLLTSFWIFLLGIISLLALKIKFKELVSFKKK